MNSKNQMNNSSFVKALFSGHLRFILRMFLLSLALLSVSRLLLMAWLWDRVEPTGELLQIILQGIRADIIMVSFWALIPILTLPFWQPNAWRTGWEKFTYSWSVLGLVFFLFMEVATPTFVMQYDLRPNRIFIEYLKYPKEVFATLWNGFRLPFVGGILLTLLLSWAASRLIKDKTKPSYQISYWYLLIIWPLLIITLAFAIRSTTQHRPANPALFAITGDALVNSLVINSSYSVIFAAYNMKHEAKSSEIYGEMATPEILRQNLDWPWLKNYHFANTKYPTAHQHTAVVQRERPLNLVIVLEESLGATFVESLGGVAVTPNLEKLKEQGWWFEQLYATGTRSVRGIEAVVAGFMPTPAQSTVKLSLSQKNFFTIADLLERKGYHTEFIYGGEAHFDNMRGFFTGNGFEQIIDFKDIKNPQFVGSWGASDEDLFNHAHQHLLQLHEQQKPFFSLIFTSSNHSPFEFPDGRIELHEQPKQVVNNAVKYADYALGEFMKKAQASAYWQDTLFLVVADHDNRVYGNSLVPVNKFHIPGVILGADIKPEKITRIASQIDLAPTLISLMGISAEHPMLGRDFAADKTSPGRALIQFDDTFALMEEQPGNTHKLTILKPSGDTVAAQYDFPNRHVSLLTEAASSSDSNKALAQVLLPSLLYREQTYYVPKQDQP